MTILGHLGVPTMMDVNERHQSEIAFLLHWVAVSLAAIGALNYLAIMGLWILCAYAAVKTASPTGTIDWWAFRHAIAAPIMFGLFVAAICKHRNKRALRSLLLLALVTMTAWSTYDCYRGNYQLSTHSFESGMDNVHVLGKGASHLYINWPWLTDLEPMLRSRRCRSAE